MLSTAMAASRFFKLKTSLVRLSGANLCYRPSVDVDDLCIEHLTEEYPPQSPPAPEELAPAPQAPAPTSGADAAADVGCADTSAEPAPTSSADAAADVGCVVSSAEVDTKELPRLLGAKRPEAVKMSTGNLSVVSGGSTTDEGGVNSGSSDGSPASTCSRNNILEALEEEPRSGWELNPLLFGQRTASLANEVAEMPGLASDGPEALVARGHLDASITDLARALLVTEGDLPMTTFLKDVLGCRNVLGGHWCQDPDFEGDEATLFSRRCRYQMPLPGDVPEVAVRLLGLGAYLDGSTTTRLTLDAARITIQESSRTEGLLYSERMRIMNTHVLEADPAGGVAWRSWTQVVWTKALPWTHAFIAKSVESRVRAEAKSITPALMHQFERAAIEVNSCSRR